LSSIQYKKKDTSQAFYIFQIKSLQLYHQEFYDNQVYYLKFLELMVIVTLVLPNLVIKSQHLNIILVFPSLTTKILTTQIKLKNSTNSLLAPWSFHL